MQKKEKKNGYRALMTLYNEWEMTVRKLNLERQRQQQQGQ